MKRIVKAFIGMVAAVAIVIGFAGCTTSDDYQRIQDRQEQAKKSAKTETLEKVNLKKKLKLEEDAERVGYVYLLSFGKPFGYYTVKGKISSSGSQVEPENLVECPYSCSAPVVVDGPQDDGTYGVGDPGIFFFTTEGVFVNTSVDYFYTTERIPNSLEIPKLG